MILDNRVKDLEQDGFRSYLTIEDIKDEYVIGHLVFEGGYMKDSEGRELKDVKDSDKIIIEEGVLPFVNHPIVFPSMPYLFYSSGIIKGVSAEYLSIIVRDLSFLNPNISKKGLLKMSKFIHRRAVSKDEHTGIYNVSLEALHEATVKIHSELDLDDLKIVETNKVVLYQRRCLFDPECKRRISNHYRMAKHVMLSMELLHNGAIFAIENTDRRIKVSNPMVKGHINKYVREYNELAIASDEKTTVLIKNTLKSDGTFYRYLNNSPKVKNYLTQNNRFRPFKTLATFNHYKKFKALCRGKTIEYYSKKLKVSNSTVIEFQEVLANENKTSK